MTRKSFTPTSRDEACGAVRGTANSRACARASGAWRTAATANADANTNIEVVRVPRTRVISRSALCGDFGFLTALRQQLEQSIDGLIDGQRFGKRNRRPPGGVQFIELCAAIVEELNDLYDFRLRASRETDRRVHERVAAAGCHDIYIGVDLVRVLHGRKLCAGSGGH